MIAYAPTVLDHSGVAFSVQTIETTNKYLLIRVRTDEKVPSGYHNTKVPALIREKFTLTDSHGTEVAQCQSSSQGEGPFEGIVDFAFPAEPRLDLSSTLTLVSGIARLTFKF